MPYLEDGYALLSVVDGVYDAVVALPHSQSIIVAGQFLASAWAWVGAQPLNPSDKRLAIDLLSDPLQLLGS